MADSDSKIAAGGAALFAVKGLCAAPFTPFHDDMSINFEAVPLVADELRRGGVHYAFVNGTTGESMKLTMSERKALTEAWMACAGDDLKVIVHVGCEALQDARELAAHSEAVGAAAIAVMPSVFFKPASLDRLVAWVEAVAKAAPKTPIYYYHIKIMTGVNFRMDYLLEKLGHIPTFVGLKYSDADLWEFANCCRVHGGRYNCLYGMDEQVVGALIMGAGGAVGSTYNYMGPVYNRLMAALKSGDLETVRLEQERSGELVKLLSMGVKYGVGTNVNKAIMQLKGVPVGPPREPGVPMTPEALAALKKDLESIGFFEWSVAKP